MCKNGRKAITSVRFFNIMYKGVWNMNCNNCKKPNLNEKKENTLNSLFEVEQFLRNFTTIWKGLKIYKIIKK